MRLRSAFVLLVLFAASGALAQAYTWTDDNGVVHYSDRPEPGAKQIALPESTGVRRAGTRASAPSASSGSGQDETTAAQPFRYETLEVNAPAAEETLWNIEGILNVSLALTPALQPGHQVRVYFDGNAQSVAGTSFQLDEVHRGVHNIQAEILDEAGQMMIRSLPNRFYVQQTTIVRPRR
ncbi:MAG: DUF4124 domain-containing protein [Woeseiaceae bacterium]